MNHTQLTKYDFVEAVKNTETYIKVNNPVFQKLILKNNRVEEFYENYRQACRYGVGYLKQKPHLLSRDVKIIEEVINNN
jgi:hypothetical protein